MWAISLRFRLYTFIFLILLVVAVCSAVLDNYFVNRERLAFIDGELDEVASLLLNSQVIESATNDVESVENLITRELGLSRLGKFFALRDATGETVFRSTSARLFPNSNIPNSPERLTVTVGGDSARILNIPIRPSKTRKQGSLQVGLIMKEELLFTPAFSSRDMIEVFSLVLIGMLLTAGMVRKFLRPLRELSGEVAELAALSASASLLPPIRAGKWAKSAEAGGTRDEYHLLVKGLDTLIDRVNRGYEVSRVWSYQMAHELKTPMAVLAAEVANGRENREISPGVADAVEREIEVASETVSAFLLWAEIESGAARKDLHVVSLRTVLEALVERTSLRGHPGVLLSIVADEKVAVTPAYLEIVLNNLVSNALLYSPEDRQVRICLNGSQIQVFDRGPGFPTEVLGRLGQPFNRGGDGPTQSRNSSRPRRSHGLGLATVVAISRVFNWRIDFGRVGDETCVTLDLEGDRLT
ncbi:MAG: HAMP domain-containing histidine kinase [Cryobacterium sp.]|nr:HAMP domain-containing histidine kinase [Oligoflexia bacterium]